MLGCGNTAGYALLKAGEIDSFKDGAARKIVVASIHRYIERKLAAAIGTASESASPRRRGRPRLKGDADRGANAAPPKKLPAPTLKPLKGNNARGVAMAANKAANPAGKKVDRLGKVCGTAAGRVRRCQR
jgi:hypothetical protein